MAMPTAIPETIARPKPTISTVVVCHSWRGSSPDWVVVTKARAIALGGGGNCGGITKRESSSHAASTPAWGAVCIRIVRYLGSAVTTALLRATAATTDARQVARIGGPRAPHQPRAGAADRPRPPPGRGPAARP